MRTAAQLLDQPGFDLTAFEFGEADQQPVAKARRADLRFVLAGGEADQGRVFSLGQPDEEIAIRIALHHVRHAHRRQGATTGHALAPASGQCAIALHRLQFAPKGGPVRALQAEMLCDLADICLARGANEGFQLGASR